MPFLRIARDQRGYETTFLVHSFHPGEQPRVLYWYRSAPEVKIGRKALDEDAIRAIEEQHPDVEFDWPQILEVGAAMVADFDARNDHVPQRRGADQERVRRKPERRREAAPPAPAVDEAASGTASVAPTPPPVAPVTPVTPPTAPRTGPDSLSELVGREIATRLRSRYAELAARIEHEADDAVRSSWRARAVAIDPDRWLTPEDILRGIQHADPLFDELRRDVAMRPPAR
ncbi:MAG TPA: hypothetical protein VNJ02_13085 [Vicinamibacterales bacterium]|nr:hypothetical protein [Vicinamibacterales bacterium]